ncbi:MAG: HesA/MoeB/ThiF family protein, partial [Propionibacteriaceae bacterium]
MAQVGPKGERRLAEARVLVVGVGGLGCAASAYLALAGVGRLRLADGDAVATSNLGRQVLFDEGDVGRPKVEAASDRLRRMNPFVEIEAIPAFAGRANLAELLAGVDLVVDGTDSLGARRLLNGALVTLGLPVVYGAATGFNGTVMACVPGGPCYGCVWTEPAETSCESDGVLGPLVGMVGAAQAAEAVRVLLGLGEPGRLLLVDALGPQWRTVRVKRRTDCP